MSNRLRLTNAAFRQPRVSFTEAGGKKCEKGKACGAACVYRGDDCVKSLPPSLQKAISTVVKEIKQHVQREGNESDVLLGLHRIDEGGDFHSKAKKIAASIDKIKLDHPSDAEGRIDQVFDLILPGIAEKGNKGNKHWHEEDHIAHLHSSKTISKYEGVYQKVKKGEYKSPEEINEALKPLAQSRRVNNISDSQVDLAMALLPKDLLVSLRSKGAPGEGGVWGEKQSTLDTPVGGHVGGTKWASTARARFIVKVGMEEGMMDVYTGQRLNWGNADLEHIIPASLAGKGAEVGSNFALTLRLNNEGKGNNSPESWRQATLRRYSAERGITPESRKALEEQKESALLYNRSRSTNPSAETIMSVFQGISMTAETKLQKQTLKNSALASLAGYTSTYLQGERDNRPGKTVRPVLYSGALGERILDRAAGLIDKYTREGNESKVVRVFEVLQSGVPEVQYLLDRKYGKKRLLSEVGSGHTDIAEEVRDRVLGDLDKV